MQQLKHQQIEIELKKFTDRNFESPHKCKNPEQIRFYVQELCSKIEEYKIRFNYVPNWAYSLLAQYTQLQNKLVYIDFRNTYQ